MALIFAAPLPVAVLVAHLVGAHGIFFGLVAVAAYVPLVFLVMSEAVTLFSALELDSPPTTSPAKGGGSHDRPGDILHLSEPRDTPRDR